MCLHVMRFLLCLLLLLAIVAAPGSGVAQEPVFTVEQVRGGLERPWSINFAPDGRLFFSSRNSGQVSALNLQTGALQNFSGMPAVRTGGEAGLLGMALDPQFAQNNTLYACYSYSAGGQPLNRLARFVINGNTISQNKVLIDAMVGANFHNGCRVVVSPDGQYLFATMGDATNTSLAQNLASTGGKTFRIFKDGALPPDNPFPGSAVWTLGHRNHQGLTFQPSTGLLWSTEHGPDTRDELNILRAAGNYGWPTCVGVQVTCAGVASYRPAVAEYETANTVAMSDLEFYSGTAFPQWSGNLFFVTLKTGRLYRLVLQGEQVAQQEILIDNDYGRLRDVAVGPDGLLYLASDNGQDSRILRLRPTSSAPLPQQLFLPLVRR